MAGTWAALKLTSRPRGDDLGDGQAAAVASGVDVDVGSGLKLPINSQGAHVC